MPPESRKLLVDMRDASHEVTAITAAESIESYRASKPLWMRLRCDAVGTASKLAGYTGKG
jgi:hypothetical protein